MSRKVGQLPYIAGFLKAVEKRMNRLRRSSRPLRVRIIGWYGFRSTGDDMMKWCIERIFHHRIKELGLLIEFTDDNICDLCVIGGGTIIGCDTSNICTRLDAIDAPLAIFGPGFRNTGEEECRKWQPKMRSLFDRAVLSGVRGPRTAEALKKYGMAENVEVIGDSAVWFESIPIPWRPPGPLVGICVREMKNVKTGGEERYVSAEDTLGKLGAIIPLVLERLSAQPVFLSFAENEFDSDSEAARQLRAMLPAQYHEAPILPYCDDVRLNTSIVGQLDYLISERMHPAIIAWLAGRPCVMLENQYGKSMDFMASIGMEEYCLRTDECDIKRYMALFDEIMNRRAKISRQANEAIDKLKQRQMSFVDTLLQMLT